MLPSPVLPDPAAFRAVPVRLPGLLTMNWRMMEDLSPRPFQVPSVFEAVPTRLFGSSSINMRARLDTCLRHFGWQLFGFHIVRIT